jgi:uncharacterized protein YbjT (DUF2867 family)
MMKIAVAGGTGVAGRHTVEAVRDSGHEVAVLSRSHGADLVSGNGLAAALVGVDAVIDVANVSTMKASAAIEFFTTASRNLISAAADAGVRHIVLLSIVGIDRMPHDYYAGKVAQEKVLEASRVPWSIQRATQFHEFAGQIFERAKAGPFHIAPRARTQPIAARDVGERLAALAAGDPQGRAQDIAGPREEALDTMIKAFARKTGHHGWIPSVNLPTEQMKGMRAGFALPTAGALLTGPTFEQWLARQRR